MAEPHILLTVVAGNARREPGAQGRLARRRLADSGRQHAAHDRLHRSSAAATPESASAALMATAPSCGRGDAGESALEGADRACGARAKMTTGSDFIGAFPELCRVDPYYRRDSASRALKAPAARRRPAQSARGCAAGRRSRLSTSSISTRIGRRWTAMPPGGRTARVP